MTVPVDVLIIEDDKQLGILVKDLLRAHWPMPGTRYLLAESLTQALGFVRILIPSLIVMDLHMEDAEGFAALHALLDTLGALQRRVPIVLLSGNLTEEDGLTAIMLGAADYIIKGSPTQSMLLAIRKVWARG